MKRNVWQCILVGLCLVALSVDGWAQAQRKPSLWLALAEAILKPHTPQEKPKPEKPVEEPVAEKLESDPRERLPELPAREVLKHARILHFKKRSKWFNLDKLEGAMLKRKEFGEMGLELTRNEKYTDLVIEVTRKFMTTRFTCSIIEPHSGRIVGAITASSLGGEIEPDLADALIKEFTRARAAK